MHRTEDVLLQLIAGRDPQPLIDVMGTSDIARGICSTLLNRDETYAENQKGQKTVQLSDKLRSAYFAIFDDSSKGEWNETRIGSCSFSRSTKNQTLQAISLLSEYASYE